MGRGALWVVHKTRKRDFSLVPGTNPGQLERDPCEIWKPGPVCGVVLRHYEFGGVNPHLKVPTVHGLYKSFSDTSAFPFV